MTPDSMGHALQQFLESFDGQSRIADDATHGVGVHRIVSRDREKNRAVRQDDMFASLTDLREAGLLQRSYGAEMRDAWNLRHTLKRNFNFPNQTGASGFGHRGQVLADRVPYVFQGFFFGAALRPAPRQARARDCKTFIGRMKHYLVSHAAHFIISRRFVGAIS